MLFESKRLQQLSGILTEDYHKDENNDILKPEAKKSHCEADSDDVLVDDKETDAEKLDEDDTVDDEEIDPVEEAIVRAQVRYHMENVWSSGAVFNKPAHLGGVALGFKGPGFK